MSVVPSADAALLKPFDESRLAKPSDWAELDDFDTEEALEAMSKRVEETFLEAKEEVAKEKAAKKAKKKALKAAMAAEIAAEDAAAAAAGDLGDIDDAEPAAKPAAT